MNYQSVAEPKHTAGKSNAPSASRNGSNGNPQKAPSNMRTVKNSAKTGTVSRKDVREAVKEVSRNRS